MTRKEFVEWLKEEITVGGALSINLPDKEYERIIDREVKALYELSPEAVKESYTIIPVDYFYKPEFRKTRTIQFPDCVISVNKFVEMKRRNAMFGINDPDFSFNRAFMADLWLGSQMNMDSVAFRTIQWSVWDQMKQFNLIDIRHRWNWNDKTLLVLGHDPKVDVFCGLCVKVEESALFEDYWCRKWIAAHMKLQANKLMTLFQVNLIGGVTINMSAYTEEANKDIEECKEKWKDNNTITWFRTIP